MSWDPHYRMYTLYVGNEWYWMWYCSLSDREYFRGAYAWT